MVKNNSKTADEAQIRQLVDGWARAIRDKNIEAAVSHYARDILLYDLAPPLVHKGVDMYKKELAEWFATFQGAVGFEVHVKHFAPTPKGKKVTVRAELLEVDGLKLRFKVEAHDEDKKVGDGTHRRAVVQIQLSK